MVSATMQLSETAVRSRMELTRPTRVDPQAHD